MGFFIGVGLMFLSLYLFGAVISVIIVLCIIAIIAIFFWWSDHTEPYNSDRAERAERTADLCGYLKEFKK